MSSCLYSVVQGPQQLETHELDVEKWQKVFDPSKPALRVSSLTLKRLMEQEYIMISKSQHGCLRLNQGKTRLSIQSWIFISSYGRHGQAGPTNQAAPQMLIDWTTAFSVGISYIRIIAVRPGKEAEVGACDFLLLDPMCRSQNAHSAFHSVKGC